MIRMEGVHKVLGAQPVLCGVDLRLDRGEIVALVGPSGTGKSVLLKHIIGLLQPDRGDIWIDGSSVTHADYRTLAALRRRMGYVFQDAALLDSLSIRENLELALEDELRAKRPFAAARRIRERLRTVNLDESVLPKRPGEISGGMRKRVGVARAILNSPEVVLYDEPTTGLDPQNVAAVNDAVLKVRAALGAASLVVTHDMISVKRIADRVALLCAGRIHFDGPVNEFFASTDPLVRSFARGASGTAA